MKTAAFKTKNEDNIETLITIDNTTNFKDFTLQFGGKIITLQIDTELNQLEIGHCKLNGIGLEMFKKFIAQLN